MTKRRADEKKKESQDQARKEHSHTETAPQDEWDGGGLCVSGEDLASARVTFDSDGDSCKHL